MKTNSFYVLYKNDKPFNDKIYSHLALAVQDAEKHCIEGEKLHILRAMYVVELKEEQVVPDKEFIKC